MRIDHLVDRGDALRLRHGDRRHRMAGMPTPERHHVDRQVAGERAVVRGRIGTVDRGVAVEHGSGRRVGLGERDLEGESLQRIGVGVAEAMAERQPGEILADPPLDHGEAERRSHILEPSGIAVVEVGVRQHRHRLRRHQPQRLDRGQRGADIVRPVRQAEGEILRQVADRSGSGRDRRRRVLDRARHAQDEIAEMRRHRRNGGQCCELFGPVEDQAGAARPSAAIRLGIAHAPVEADAVPVRRPTALGQTVMDLGIGTAAVLQPAIADLGMKGEASLGHRPPLERQLAIDAMLRQERIRPHTAAFARSRPRVSAARPSIRPSGKTRSRRSRGPSIGETCLIGAVGEDPGYERSCESLSAPPQPVNCLAYSPCSQRRDLAKIAHPVSRLGLPIARP